MSQTIEVTYKVTGLDLIFLIGGTVVIVVGIVLAIIAWRIKNKEIEQPPTESRPIDVTTFEDKPKMP